MLGTSIFYLAIQALRNDAERSIRSHYLGNFRTPPGVQRLFDYGKVKALYMTPLKFRHKKTLSVY